MKVHSKPDRRTIRTKRLLREALMSLILAKGYDEVTIEDITQQADLGRTTFYLHYRDKEELLVETIEAVAKELKEEILSSVMADWSLKEGAQAPILPVFRHAAQNADLYRIILRGEGASRMMNHLLEFISQSFCEILIEQENRGSLKLEPQVPLEVFSSYFASSLLGMVNWWLEKNTPYSPEEMTENFQRLFFLGGRIVLGIPAL